LYYDSISETKDPNYQPEIRNKQKDDTHKFKAQVEAAYKKINTQNSSYQPVSGHLCNNNGNWDEKLQKCICEGK